MGRDMSACGNTNHETAKEAARGFTYCAAQPADSMEERLGRRTMPPHHRGLTRSKAVTYWQLQSGSLPTPNPREARTVTTIPPWLAATREEQTRAIQWILSALEKQHPSESARCPLPPQHRGRRRCQKAGVAKAARRVEGIMPR
ncbi:hypothetical protein HPB50_023311 [Hyalomma asiaticum]|uniref:Uncharacterized protein n=1 Tax=Hyalomma asiaticum TaxID=266040 RepID=A0ACB7TMK0_HYAAI|nr:hypothetical protein HPB50_023311 [Hyalomma asiaticum]